MFLDPPGNADQGYRLAFCTLMVGRQLQVDSFRTFAGQEEDGRPLGYAGLSNTS
ncbi:MAG: hypothetical protein KJ069_10245 [Anaerolineae bacterium]|nr:hypothetical protein [Anaerolineae bacterium]